MNRPSCKRRQKGAVLVMALVFLAVLTLVLSATIHFVVRTYRVSNQYSSLGRVERALDAGLARAAGRLDREAASPFQMDGTVQGVAYQAACMPLSPDRCRVEVRAAPKNGEALTLAAVLRRQVPSGEASAPRWAVERYQRSRR